MTDKPKVLDAYCCQGGSGRGWDLSGFEVTGVDIRPQPRYPFTFVQADAVQYITEHGHEYDLIAGSPPCQLDSDCQRIMQRSHPDLIGPTRDAMVRTGKPYVIENVKGALPKLISPVMLCGTMFGLRTYRHRYFESSFPLAAPDHAAHAYPQVKMGRAPRNGEFVQAVGNFSGVGLVRDDWGVPWMNRDGLREAIPPAYTEWIGRAFLAQRSEIG